VLGPQHRIHGTSRGSAVQHARWTLLSVLLASSVIHAAIATELTRAQVPLDGRADGPLVGNDQTPSGGDSKSGPADQQPTAGGADETLEEHEDRLVREGIALRRAGDDAQAIDKFRQAYALGRDARPLAHMAFAEQAMGRWAAAYQHLRDALAVEGHSWIDANREKFGGELAALEQRIARLTLVIEPASAEVLVNGQPVGKAPLAQPLVLAPGTTVIEVQMDDYVTYRRELHVREGGVYRQTAHLQPAPSERVVRSESPPSKTLRADARTPPSRGLGQGEPAVQRNPLWLYVAGGGAVIAAAASIPWAIGEARVAALERECRQFDDCPDYDHRQRPSVERLDTLTNVMLLGGTAIGLAALATWWFWTDTDAEQPTNDLSLWLTPDVRGFSYGSRF
jgi:hypothetical protein